MYPTEGKKMMSSQSYTSVILGPIDKPYYGVVTVYVPTASIVGSYIIVRIDSTQIVVPKSLTNAMSHGSSIGVISINPESVITPNITDMIIHVYTSPAIIYEMMSGPKYETYSFNGNDDRYHCNLHGVVTLTVDEEYFIPGADEAIIRIDGNDIEVKKIHGGPSIVTHPYPITIRYCDPFAVHDPIITIDNADMVSINIITKSE